jgi:hypothetical protein
VRPLDGQGARWAGRALGGDGNLINDSLDAGARLIDLSRHRLKVMLEPERVYQLARAGLDAEFAPLRSAGGRPNNLPADVKTFVGRQHELDRLQSCSSRPVSAS